MRIAFFGGSFDPPHRGHLAIARAALERLRLDEVWMAPTGAQPLKRAAAAASYEDRLAMVELAVADTPGIVASRIDAPRSDGQPNFTIDVLTAIEANLQTGDELFFLLGADSLLSLKQWRRASELLFVCKWIVAGRPGSSVDDVAAALARDILAERNDGPGIFPDVVCWELRNLEGEHSRLYLMPDLHEDVSATDIRSAIAGEQSASGVLASAVRRYIEEKGLYR